MAILDAALASNEILLVDDDVHTLKALSRLLEAEHYVVRSATTGQDAIKQVEIALPYIILLDLGLPDANGVDLLNRFLLEGVKHVIIVSGTDSVETTRSCLRAGAFDFLLKPAGRKELLQAVRRASSAYDVGQMSSQQYPLELHPGFGALETPSAASQKLFRQLKQFRTTASANSLIRGPAGLLKRDIATLVHHYNDRSGPALLINCALETDDDALARFTQPVQSSNNPTQIGYIEQAAGSSLVLDDISLLPLSVQRWLVAYIDRIDAINNSNQQASFQASCNIIGILRESIELCLEEGRLLPELHTRLSNNLILVPALSERPEDVPVYAQQAIAQLNTLLNCEKSLSSEFLSFLSAQSWEGNLVELKNRLLIAYRATEDGEEIVYDPQLWPPMIHDALTCKSHSTGVVCAIGMSLEDAEYRLIKVTLDSVEDNKSKAAKILGISVKTLYNRLKR